MSNAKGIKYDSTLFLVDTDDLGDHVRDLIADFRAGRSDLSVEEIMALRNLWLELRNGEPAEAHKRTLAIVRHFEAKDCEQCHGRGFTQQDGRSFECDHGRQS